MSSKLIFWLHELGREDVQLVGQKCAFLAELVRIGLPVPPGFVLSLRAFENFMEVTDTKEEVSHYLRRSGEALRDLRQAEKTSRHIYEIIQKREIPQEIRLQIEVSYEKLSGEQGVNQIPVSVRSSGRESHPGLFDTYLNVRGSSEVVLHVRSCWASVFTPRAIATRAQKGLPAQIEPIAVGVQKMVPARCAGVLFTADPISSDPSLAVLEASWGLGEGVAQARVTPDKFIVDKETLSIRQKYISQKTSQVLAVEQGTRVEQVPQKQQAIPCLSDKEIIELVKLAKLVELRYEGAPQDIEWVIDATLPFPSNIFLVQTRPLTGFTREIRRFNKPTGKGDADHIVDSLIEHFYQ